MFDSTGRVTFLTSLEERRRNYGELFDQLHGRTGKVNFLRIVTGYYDETSIRQVIDWLEERSSLKGNIRFELYLNRTKLPDKIKLLEKLNREIRRKFTNDESGIYLFVEHFVHMKCFHIQGEARASFVIGSNNLTRRALEDNEELMSKIQYDPQVEDSSSPGELLDQYLWKFYENNREDLCVYIDAYDPKSTPQPNDLRDYLLEGELWTELATSDPYSLQLNLPDELLDEASPNLEEFEGFLDAETEDSLNTKKLIERCSKDDGKINKRLNQIDQIRIDGRGLRSKWKNYTLETTLGHWARIDDRCLIEAELLKKHKMEDIHKLYLAILEKCSPTLRNKFLQWVRSILRLIEEKGILVDSNSDWFTASNELDQKSSFGPTSCVRNWERKWDEHVVRLKSKLDDEQYRKRLVRGVISTPVPDMRSDDDSLDSFVKSFVDSFDYYQQRQNQRTLDNNDEIKKLVENWKAQQN